MGGRGYSSATSRRSESGRAKGFTIDTGADFQKISTGMAPMDAINMAADQIVGLDYEMAVMVTPDGTMYVSSGKANSVIPPYKQVEADGFSVSETLDLHNHPSPGKRPFGGPSSSSDWNAMFSFGQTENHIVAKEGRYIMRITDQSKIDKAKAFFTNRKKSGYWFERKQSNFEKNIKKTYEAGMWDKYSEPGGSLKAAMHTLEKFGPRYGFELEFRPNPGWENLYK